jgi:hypothetical protein
MPVDQQQDQTGQLQQAPVDQQINQDAGDINIKAQQELFSGEK